MLGVLGWERRRTCALQTLQRGGESFGSGQKVVFELGQTFALCNLHTDLVLLLREASALAIQQKLRGGGRRALLHEERSQGSEATSRPSSRVTAPCDVSYKAAERADGHVIRAELTSEQTVMRSAAEPPPLQECGPRRASVHLHDASMWPCVFRLFVENPVQGVCQDNNKQGRSC